MAIQPSLAKSAYLLREFQRECHALPLRLRALNMFTYSLDILFIQGAAELVHEAESSHAAVARLRALSAAALELLDEAAETVRVDVLPLMAARGVLLRSVEECSEAERQWLAAHFGERVRPLLTPLAVDAGHPFPQISTHSLNLLAVLQEPMRFDVEMPSFARLKVPRWVPRMVELLGSEPARQGAQAGGQGAQPARRRFVLSEDMVRAHVDTLFNGMTVEGVYQFRILRGEHTGSEGPVGRHTALARQKAWPVVRLDVERNTPDWVVQWLQQNLGVQEAVVLRRPPPLGLGTLAVDWAERTSIRGTTTTRTYTEKAETTGTAR